MVKEPDENDPSSGIYMGHYWECPVFSGVLDYPVNDQNKIDKDSPKIQVLNAQFDSYVENFMSNGFSQPTMKNWVTDPDSIPQQDGIKEHLTSLA
ncbi:hypothetical protein MMC31_001438, partial [Peltigera leucophlebia]|nr:hypothetical protein [Peltigera leucophlebia]